MNGISETSTPARTILIVDDEPDILRLADNILAAQGYLVVLARGAAAALRTFQAMSPQPDLLLTDVVMPGMSGPMLADDLLARCPHMQVLFMSGYDERQVVQKYVVEKGFALVPKPFTPQRLTSAVREALSGRAPVGAQV